MTDQTPDWIRDMEGAGGASFALDEGKPAPRTGSRELELTATVQITTLRGLVVAAAALLAMLATLAVTPTLVLATWQALL